MGRQSVGVTPFKHLIKWCFPAATAAFDGCAAQHDKDYKTVDWSKGADATADIDGKFHACCIGVASCAGPGGTVDAALLEDANRFYAVARRWGIGRAFAWKYLHIRY